MTSLIGRPPETLDLDCEELEHLRKLYEFLRRNQDYETDHVNFTPTEDVFAYFAVVKKFYQRRRRKH